MNTRKNDFAVTRDLFESHIRYSRPLTFEEWLMTADDLKSAVLYCQFFEQITLAWYKLASVYSVEADGVDEICQYLEKNVKKIKQDSRRFTPSYIYKVAYNCLYCLCRDPNRYKAAYENEMSNICVSGEGDEYDLFDTVATHSCEEEYEVRSREGFRDLIWKKIEELGDEEHGGSRDYIILVAELLGDDLDWTEKYKKSDFKDPSKPIDYRVYRESVECAPANIAKKMEGIRSTLGDALVSDFEVSYNKAGRAVIKYSVKKERIYNGLGKFSKRDKERITPERRAEMMAKLREVLEPLKDFCI